MLVLAQLLWTREGVMFAGPGAAARVSPLLVLLLMLMMMVVMMVMLLVVLMLAVVVVTLLQQGAVVTVVVVVVPVSQVKRRVVSVQQERRRRRIGQVRKVRVRLLVRMVWSEVTAGSMVQVFGSQPDPHLTVHKTVRNKGSFGCTCRPCLHLIAVQRLLLLLVQLILV